ncbi:MAG: cyclic nucleotide-binding domain-containing protein [Pedobacter sp.]|uniref:cyclic nucleotide-binding domain-containing protein n=1 Tax=Pedobacter sp. TaxID=1411316 RepID=UPI003561C93F
MNTDNNLQTYIDKLFPQFEPALKQILIENGSIKSFEDGEMLMQTGQNMRSTMLIVEGVVKLYREGEDGNEFFMYYLQPGDACALSMICAAKQETSQVMAKAVDSAKGLLIPISLMDTLMKIDKHKSYFVHCAGGYRSMIFNSILRARGFDNLIDIQGGFKAIQESGILETSSYICPSKMTKN